MILRLAKEEDFSFLYETRRHPLVDNMLSGEAPKDYRSHLSFLERTLEKTRWILIATSDNTSIGYSQIYDVREDQLEVGFVIHPNYQGKGFGKKIVLRTIEKAEELFPNKKIVLYVKKDNLKAIHIYRDLGFIDCGVKEDTLYMERK